MKNFLKKSVKTAECPYCHAIGKVDRHGDDNILNCPCGMTTSHPEIEVTNWSKLFTLMILMISKL